MCQLLLNFGLRFSWKARIPSPAKHNQSARQLRIFPGDFVAYVSTTYSACDGRQGFTGTTHLPYYKVPANTGTYTKPN
ncbi:hypothetical protein [Rhodoferax sp.]|uniref:hypothetical protein n=1 Tax=Rhodoferax sp. TaxID=50421 RepID=UPI002852B9DE|nr:hypothetical protein [Rhodoferax sp.]